MIPQTFEDWRRCIVVDCKIDLTKEFASKRLEVYENNTHLETQKFTMLYGNQHLKNIIDWYKAI